MTGKISYFILKIYIKKRKTQYIREKHVDTWQTQTKVNCVVVITVSLIMHTIDWIREVVEPPEPDDDEQLSFRFMMRLKFSLGWTSPFAFSFAWTILLIRGGRDLKHKNMLMQLCVYILLYFQDSFWYLFILFCNAVYYRSNLKCLMLQPLRLVTTPKNK